MQGAATLHECTGTCCLVDRATAAARLEREQFDDFTSTSIGIRAPRNSSIKAAASAATSAEHAIVLAQRDKHEAERAPCGVVEQVNAVLASLQHTVKMRRRSALRLP